ncbi:molybdopterin molybdochelatase [Tumebacillus sp. BK434]|uniref:molybdopterin molybdotransferase MoeA n=1 Tax=Tumebacillus sp. BK434 TaxID=2512169 RepID=UPI00104F260C|nr:gephyrin-like molybdotransferase Glp [Tumebacillus sp. BK434]TCP52390.1 molybdopterin molybdochelatase [Tumebacillus sp. BK434]
MEMFLRLEEAWDVTLGRTQTCPQETVPLLEAYGRVLAETVRARAPFPPFDRSALDGFAVRAADVQGASPQSPVLLHVLEEVPAGSMPSLTVGPGQAAKVMTGAPIPAGADAIVRKEAAELLAVPTAGQAGRSDASDAQPCPNQTVRILLEVPAGEAISVQGEDAPEGALLLEAGTVIGAAETAVLATNGAATVSVFRKPRVGILVSGSEVRPQSGELQPGQIRDSNGPMLAALVRDLGGDPVLYGQVGDDLEAIAALVKEMAERCDLVLTTGGVSVGDYDVMRDAYVQAGGAVVFWKVAMRPGTPVTFAEVAGTPVYGLSGNPAAAYVNFVMLVVPVLRKLAGLSEVLPRPVQAFLDSAGTAKVIGLDRFLRAELVAKEGRLVARAGSGQKAAILTSLVGIQGLVRIPARQEIENGSLVDVYLLREGALAR